MADTDADSDRPETEEDEGEPRVTAPASRDRDLIGRSRKGSPIRKRLDDIREAVRQGFQEQSHRADDQQDYWDCFNCEPNENQSYNGNASIYIPIIRDAVNARATRFVNQLFPQVGRFVEAIAADGEAVPQLIALLDHYIRTIRFKTQVAKPLCRNGDIEGQYNLYADWNEVERQIVSRETHGPIDPETGVETPGEEIEDIDEQDVVDGHPIFEVLHDCDVLVLPATVDSVDEALQVGGSVTIVRRWTKAKIDQMAASGAILKTEARNLKDSMGRVMQEQRHAEKGLAEHTGIRPGGREAVVWETWAMLPLDGQGRFNEDGRQRLCRVFFGPGDADLGAKRNPYWNDRCPLLSCPVEKISGVFKGASLVAPVASLQYEANDAANEGADAAAYSAMPIIASDPAQQNGPLILNLAAIWPMPPGAVQFMQFPDLTPRAITRIQFCISAIMQDLGVNPSMMPQQTSTDRRNQAEIAQDQAVDLLTTAEAVSVMEEGIFTPATSWMVDLDYQFRDYDLTVRMFGEMGEQARMQAVAPLQNRRGFAFVWRGGDQARQNAMMMQQGTGWLNVLRSMRQDLMAEGLQLRLGPLIEAGTRNLFGPILGGQVIVDQRSQLTVPQDEENVWLADGFMTPVHPLDNDEEHLPIVMQMIQATGDPHGTGRVHAQAHLQQRAMKAQAAQMQQMQQMMAAQQGQGAPPGRGPQPGGGPQQGAQPAGPRLIKGPPGTIHQDNMAKAGGIGMPRNM